MPFITKNIGEQMETMPPLTFSLAAKCKAKAPPIDSPMTKFVYI